MNDWFIDAGWFRWCLVRVTASNFAGVWYERYRENGRVVWLWRRKSAEALMRKMNASTS